ncbi:MAG TPA: hypothetical protein VF681_14685 [Abditibacteriaceae bacterium]|jgi:hypothetical protein
MAWSDPDLDPCSSGRGSNGNHSRSWIDGGRCEWCGAGSVEEVNAQERKEKASLAARMLPAYRPTDSYPLSRGGREHVKGLGCWCKPEMKFDPKTFTSLVKHRDPEKGVKGEA